MQGDLSDSYERLREREKGITDTFTFAKMMSYAKKYNLDEDGLIKKIRERLWELAHQGRFCDFKELQRRTGYTITKESELYKAIAHYVIH